MYAQGVDNVKDRLEDYVGRDAVMGSYMLSYVYDFPMQEEFLDSDQWVTDIRNAVRPLAMDKAQFRGYWFDPVATAAPDIRVSAFTWKPGEGKVPFLLAAGNFGRTDRAMELRPDWSKLGGRPARLKDLVSGQVIAADELESFVLRSHNFVLLVEEE